MRDLLDAAITARASFVDPEHRTAFRLFNGFSEGLPTLALDVYANALLIHDYSAAGAPEVCQEALAVVRARLPWLTAAVVKVRSGSRQERNGALLMTGPLPDRVYENGVWYALDLIFNRDASFYLDTRNLRAWATAHLHGARVLNTFAYTGSLSVAARAAGACEVSTTDANRQFLATAKRSYALNNFAVDPKAFLVSDFFAQVAALKRQRTLFDCVFLDPPVFASRNDTRVDLQLSMRQLINKVHPLVGHDGRLVLVNNAVFFSGADYMALLASVCKSGFLRIEQLIPVPSDYTGVIQSVPLVDPAPFNHSTKIAILRAKRKDRRTAHGA